MGRDYRNPGRGDPEARQGQKKPRSGNAAGSNGTNGFNRQQPAYAFAGGRARADDGRSGYGSESVRPYLRAQLKLKELLAPAYNLGEGWSKRNGKKNGER